MYKSILINRNVPDIVLQVLGRQKSTDSDMIIGVFLCIDGLKGSLGEEVRVTILDAKGRLRHKYWKGNT